MKTIHAFHIGRGGRFYNQGFKSYLGEKTINEFTSDLFTTRKNQSKLFEMIKDKPNLLEKYYQACDSDIWTFFENKLGIDLGEVIYVDECRNEVGLTESECLTGIGKINIDGSYDTTYTCYLEDCDEEELELINNSK